MAKINYQIQEGKFSVVLKRIASILLIEFAHQITLGNTFLPTNVYYDTDFAVDEGNIPWVSVNWSDFENKDDSKGFSDNTNKYFIDIKAVGYETTQKIIAIVRTILKSMQYDKLDFDYGIIAEVKVTSGGINFEENLRDSQGTISGGVNYQCTVTESNDAPVSTPLVDSIYESGINETDKKLTLQQNY